VIDYLYHYTNLDTLKKILGNKTFRLSSLSRMDDLEEGDTEDFERFGRYIYISSWTNYSEESLLLWNYSRGDDGVRIRMKPHIFKTERINKVIDIHGFNVPVNDVFHLGILELMKKENLLFMPPRAELKKVTYTDLERLLKPKVYHEYPGDHFAIETQNLGIFKRTEWQEQREWRYRLSSLPLNLGEFESYVHTGDKRQLLNKLRSRQEKNYIDLPLNENAFDELEILCGPLMSEAGKSELEEIVQTYVPDAVIKYSKLKMR